MITITKSDIEWCDYTQNPVTGCTPISPGCKNCYALRMIPRLKAMGQEKYQNGLNVCVHPDVLDRPAKIKQPAKIFVNSMSDLYHKDVPDTFIKLTYEAMERAPWHTFLTLTKRSTRLAGFSRDVVPPDNHWVGVTVEDNAHLYRLDNLRTVPAVVRFVSFEPLLSELQDIDLTGIDWVIVGGETGPGARTMDLDWARKIRDLCQEQHVPFFFKSVGGVRKPKGHGMLDGVYWREFPTPKNR